MEEGTGGRGGGKRQGEGERDAGEGGVGEGGGGIDSHLTGRNVCLLDVIIYRTPSINVQR